MKRAGLHSALFLFLIVFQCCAPRTEKFIYARVSPGDAFEGILKSAEGKAAFRVTASVDGLPSRDIFSTTLDKGLKTHKPVKIGLDDYAGQFVKLSITSRGDGASWEKARISHWKVKSVAQRSPCPDGKCNVIVYLVDALRKDRLGCYGYKPPTSPMVDDFASRSIVFTRAYSPSSWTRSSVASLFTGLYPPSHGAISRTDGLAKDIPTLAQALKDAGYYTAAFFANGNISSELGFGRGFDTYMYIPENPAAEGVYPSSRELLDKALPLLEKAPEPFFAYIHVLEPHAPYTPSPGGVSRFIPSGAVKTPGDMETFKRFIWRNPPASPAQVRYLSGLYDAEIASMDAQFGRFKRWLESRSLTDRSIVIFTADHGEEFYEHGGLGHGGTLYEELVTIPLIVKLPGGSGSKSETPASLIDIMPTLLHLLGLSPPDGLEGKDIIALSSEKGGEKHRPLCMYQKLDKVEKEAVIDWPFKLIHNINRTNQWGERVLEWEFYDLRTGGPLDYKALGGNLPITRKTLLESMERMRGVERRGAAPDVTDELRRRLEALGY